MNDSGNYFVLLEIPESRTVDVGALGKLNIKAGWYVYAGSARKNLSSRLARHLRKTGKKKHWHIDYLTPCAKTIEAFPVFTPRNMECRLAVELENMGGRGIPGFGCSDCRCRSHLFYFSASPDLAYLMPSISDTVVSM